MLRATGSVMFWLALAACDRGEQAKPAQAPPPVQVGVITLQVKPVTLERELPGRMSAMRVAEVRARVNGIIQKRLFEEGSDVREGQPLFKIDPAPYQAALESARAQLVRAQATVESAKTLVDRYSGLIQTHAISEQEYDDAVARMKTAQADVAAGRAAVTAAGINVGYTTVTSPIAGRIGRAEVTEGAYVQQASATLLATVQQLDRMYVDLTWSSLDALQLRRAIERGEVQSQGGQPPVTLILEDGSPYPLTGTLQFADVSVEATTGSIALRAVVANPKHELLPGMFVRARVPEGTRPDALLVPQRAVSRDQGGKPFAWVVNAQGQAERRQLTTDRAIGDAWLVTDGVRAGERVIVDGLQRVRPGAQVTVAKQG